MLNPDYVPLAARGLLAARAMSAIQERNCGVLVLGELGTGKTTFMEEVLARADGLFIVRLRGSTIAGRRPYGSLSGLLEGCALLDGGLDGGAGPDGPGDGPMRGPAGHSSWAGTGCYDSGGCPDPAGAGLHPVVVFQQVGRCLAERAQGRRILVCVDNAHMLDPESALTLSLLAAAGQVLLLAACENLPGTPHDFIRLWKDGLLERVDLGNFDLPETGEWAQAVLGGPVSRLAVRSLWVRSGGNPLMLRSLLEDQEHSGDIVQRDGVWVLAQPPEAPSRRIQDVIGARLNRLEPQERRLLEVLALAGGLPQPVVLRLAGAAEVEALLERGLVGPEPGRVPRVAIRNPLVATVAAGSVPPGRSLQLRLAVLAALQEEEQGRKASRTEHNTGAERATSAEAVRLADWTLSCGGALDPELAVPAARRAVRQHRPAEALGFLAVLPDGRHRHDVAVLTARALFQLGQPAEAEAVLDEFAAGPAQALPPQQWADFLLECSELALTVRDDPQEARAYLAQIRERFFGRDSRRDGRCRNDGGRHGTGGNGIGGNATARHDGGPLTFLPELRGRLVLAEARAAAHAGLHRDFVPALTDLYLDRQLSAQLRVKAGCLLGEALALAGRQADALRLVEELAEKLAAAPGLNHLAAEANHRFFVVHFLAGQWQHCLQLLELSAAAVPPGSVRAEDAAGVGSPAGTCGQLAQGLVHAFAGRADRALEALLPAISQADRPELEPERGLGLAAAAFCHALLEQPVQARRCLDEQAELGRGSSWRLSQPASYFAAAARALLEPGPDALRRLLDLADRERACGRTATELLLLTAAASHPGPEMPERRAAAERLLATAGQCQGPLADAARMFADGQLHGDTGTLLRASRQAELIGHDLLARDAALAAREMAVRTNNRAAAKQALHRTALSERRLGWQQHSPEPAGGAAELTVREREVVAFALAGASNRAIARQLHVSVRTVEGHLYQIYAKLNIPGRAALGEALGAVPCGQALA